MYICLDVVKTTQNAVLLSLDNNTLAFWIPLGAISETPELSELQRVEKEPDYLGDFSSKRGSDKCVLDSDSSKHFKSRTILKLNEYGIGLVTEKLDKAQSLIDALKSRI